MSKMNCRLFETNFFATLGGRTMLEHFQAIDEYCMSKYANAERSRERVTLARVARWAQQHSIHVNR